jgi:hypothetical protein
MMTHCNPENRDGLKSENVALKNDVHIWNMPT